MAKQQSEETIEDKIGRLNDHLKHCTTDIKFYENQIVKCKNKGDTELEERAKKMKGGLEEQAQKLEKEREDLERELEEQAQKLEKERENLEREIEERVQKLEKEREDLESKKHSHIILWDKDSLKENHNPESEAGKLASLARRILLGKEGVHSVLIETEEENHQSLNDKLFDGKLKWEDTQTVSEGIREHGKKTITQYLKNSTSISGAEYMKEDHRILVSSEFKYHQNVENELYPFVYVSPKNEGKDAFFNQNHYAKLILLVTESDLDEAINLIQRDNENDLETQNKLIKLVTDEYNFENNLKNQQTNFESLLNYLNEAKVNNNDLTEALQNSGKKLKKLYFKVKLKAKVHPQEVDEILQSLQSVMESLKNNDELSELYEKAKEKLNEISEKFSQSSTLFRQYHSVDSPSQLLLEALKGRRQYLEGKVNNAKLNKKSKAKYIEELTKINNFIGKLEEGRKESDFEKYKQSFKEAVTQIENTGYLEELGKDPHHTAKKILHTVLKILTLFSIIGWGILLADGLHKDFYGSGLLDNPKHQQREIEEKKIRESIVSRVNEAKHYNPTLFGNPQRQEEKEEKEENILNRESSDNQNIYSI